MSNRFGPRTRMTALGTRVSSWGSTIHAVKLVQRGTVTIANGNATGTQAITAVVTSNSYVRITGFTATAPISTQAERFPALTLTSATVVTATRQGVDASSCIVSFEVVEYFPGILKRVQPVIATITAGNTVGTGSVPTAVAATKAQIVMGGVTTNSATGALADTTAQVQLSATVVTATRLGNADAMSVYSTVVEFN